VPLTLVHAGKVHFRRQVNTENVETKHSLQKTKSAIHCKAKLSWFSRLLRHSARKRAVLILRRSRAHKGLS